MSGFDAGALVEPLDYNFKPFCPEISGTIPEPTDKQIEAFLAKIKTIMEGANKEIGSLSADDPEAFLEALTSLDPKMVTGTIRNMARAYADLCSNHPSFEDLMKVPMRVRILFFRWVQQEVFSPEVKTGAGTAVVTPLSRAVAGSSST
jgi:hypothetical protein